MLKLIIISHNVIKRIYYYKRVLLQFIVPDTIYKIKPRLFIVNSMKVAESHIITIF